jgi:hypothetical protein
LPNQNPIDPAPSLHGAAFRLTRTAHGITLNFPVLRAPGAALGLMAFALLCGAMPALGLSALLPLEAGNASAMVSLALIGGFAAPFILASVVFGLLAVYLLANDLHVEISAGGVRTTRRVFGRVTRRCEIARAHIAGVEPRIGARYQNVFSATPRYALIATHTTLRGSDVVIAEDVAGHARMIHLRSVICDAIGLPLPLTDDG